ncbi:MAG: M23 family metallopeptidase [Algicola sp.]|nr:M23 family metallopeptidase [Algicola sp.]
MKRFGVVVALIFLTCLSCKKNQKTHVTESTSKNGIEKNHSANLASQKSAKTLFTNHTEFISNGFDFPVGKPDGHQYYNAQKFQENDHLGDDWNGIHGGNSDLGDPIYAIANGYISEVKDYGGGWGNVIRVVHQHKDQLYESLYAHCDSVVVLEDTYIKKGEQLGTIGNCNGRYLAHLHLEIRDILNLDIGSGYGSDITGYLDPTLFITKNRK